MKAPVPFTRDEIAAYEKGPQTGADPNAGKQPVTAAKIGFVDDPTPDQAPVVPDPAAEAAAAAAAEAAGATEQDPPPDPSTGGEPDPTASGEDASAAAADSATATADPDGEGAPPANDPPPAKKGGAQERIEGLASENNALRKYGEHILEYNKRLQDRLAELERTGKPAADAAPAAPKVPAAKDDPMPTMADHKFDPDAFGKALGEWNQREITRGVAAGLAAKEAADRQANARRNAETVINDFNTAVEDFKKVTTDYETVISNPALPQLSPDASGHLVRNKQIDVLYYLAKNPDKLTRIARMDPASQLEHLGRIRAQLDAAAAAKPKTTPKPGATPPQKRTTQAPPPPKPVTGNSPAVKQPHEMSMDEFVAAERQKKIDQRKAALVRKGLR